jgi:hypothetical protein
MNEERITEGSSWSNPRGQVMKTPDDAAEMLRLRACGWGLKKKDVVTPVEPTSSG